ncbi:MAG: hypothetical protein L3J00_03125 [Thiomicrorhabdus sp.]|nr:hypothetical protein [Thiomicrorhabdus sp.]
MPVDYIAFHSSIPVTSNSSEIELRNNISRNYYAILHYLKAYICKNKIPDGVYATGTHQQVIDALSSHLKDKGDGIIEKRLKIIFTNSKTFRVKADYLLDKDIKYSDANQVSGALEKVKNLLEP